MVLICRLLQKFISNQPITLEQVFHIDSDTTVDMERTWNEFTYKKHDLHTTLDALLKNNIYG